MKKCKNIFLALTLFCSVLANAQLGIGSLIPEPSAELGLSSTSSGFLLPVLTEVQRDAISNPAEGLLVYCNDCSPKSYYSYVNGTWIYLQNGSEDYDAALVILEGNNFKGNDGNLSSSIFDPSVSTNNIAIGLNIFRYLEAGSNNICIGQTNLQNFKSGDDNILMGYSAMNKAINADKNVALGVNALTKLTGNSSSTSNNAAVGFYSLANINGANASAGLGSYAGYSLLSDSSVSMGYAAGYSLSDSLEEKLYIAAYSIHDSLITGDFKLNHVGINSGESTVGNADAATLHIEGDLSILNGETINEITTNTYMAGKSSSALPTERAVAKFVTRKKGNSNAIPKVEISLNSDLLNVNNDSTLSQQAIKAYVGTEMLLKASSNEFAASLNEVSNDSIISQRTIKTFADNLSTALNLSDILDPVSIDASLSGNSNDSVSTQQAVKNYTDNALGNIDLLGALDMLSTDGSLNGNDNDSIPTQKAVKTYVDTEIYLENLIDIVSSDTTLTPKLHSLITTQRAVKAYADALYTNWSENRLYLSGAGTYNYYTANEWQNITSSANRNMNLGYSASSNDLSSGNDNISIGQYAGRDVSSGNSNTSIGNQSFRDNTTGSNHSSFGMFAGYYGDDGHGNTAMGYRALYGTSFSSIFYTYGSYNTALGFYAGRFIEQNDYNVFVGRSAGEGAKGGNNVFMGYDAGSTFTSSGDDDYFIISNNDGISPILGGNFDNNVVTINRSVLSTGAALQVGGDASKTVAGSWSANSDQRLKTEIEYMEANEILDKMLNLKGATYFWNDTVTGTPRPENKQFGFIAQDIQKVWPSKVHTDGLGYLETAYGDYDPMLVESLRAIRNHIENVKLENEALKEEILLQQQQDNALEKQMDALINQNESIKSEFKNLEELVLLTEQLERKLQTQNTKNISASTH